MLNVRFKNCFTRNICNNVRKEIRHHCDLPAVVMNNGNEMPVVGLGTWSGNSEDVKENSKNIAKAVGWAIDAGYRHFDCAHFYQNQCEIGQVLKQKIEVEAVAREELFITSKLWNTHHDPDNVCNACKQTLEDLNVDYLDMYLMHTPMGFQYSEELFPLCEGKILFSDVDYIDTWQAMEELVEKKMCKNIGISNFNMQQVKRLLKNCKIVPQTLQLELHPYLTQKKLTQFAKCQDICITAYAPVGSPAWSKKQDKNAKNNLLTDYKILQLADKHQRSPAQILLRFQVQCGHVVIPKSTDKKHIADNIAIFDFELSSDDVRNIESLNYNARSFQLIGFVFTIWGG